MMVIALFASPTSAAHAKSARTAKLASAPAADPFASFIAEASQRFGIPGHWIRAVMHVESAGRPHTVSPKGAMGLMQIMPKTWTELRERYRLGGDPYDPRTNILAGAAYLRELHDRYGAPGFLAAYNAGPGRYDRHLATGRTLPAETSAYVAKLTPMIEAKHVGKQIMVGTIAPTWRQASLFVAQGNDNLAGIRLSSTQRPRHTSNIRPVVDLSALVPQSIGLFVHPARQARSQ
jgi:soluble lytic murein transglycosylase-like protein